MSKVIPFAWFIIQRKNSLSERRDAGFWKRRQILLMSALVIYYSILLYLGYANRIKSLRHGYSPIHYTIMRPGIGDIIFASQTLTVQIQNSLRIKLKYRLRAKR